MIQPQNHVFCLNSFGAMTCELHSQGDPAGGMPFGLRIVSLLNGIKQKIRTSVVFSMPFGFPRFDAKCFRTIVVNDIKRSDLSTLHHSECDY